MVNIKNKILLTGFLLLASLCSVQAANNSPTCSRQLCFTSDNDKTKTMETRPATPTAEDIAKLVNVNDLDELKDFLAEQDKRSSADATIQVGRLQQQVATDYKQAHRLQQAIIKKEEEVVAKALAEGINPNYVLLDPNPLNAASSVSPMFTLVYNFNPSIAEILVKAGGNINARGGFSAANPTGTSMLHTACTYKIYKVAAFLVNHGAIITSADIKTAQTIRDDDMLVLLIEGLKKKKAAKDEKKS